MKTQRDLIKQIKNLVKVKDAFYHFNHNTEERELIIILKTEIPIIVSTNCNYNEAKKIVEEVTRNGW